MKTKSRSMFCNFFRQSQCHVVIIGYESNIDGTGFKYRKDEEHIRWYLETIFFNNQNNLLKSGLPEEGFAYNHIVKKVPVTGPLAHMSGSPVQNQLGGTLVRYAAKFNLSEKEFQNLINSKAYQRFDRKDQHEIINMEKYARLHQFLQSELIELNIDMQDDRNRNNWYRYKTIQNLREMQEDSFFCCRFDITS